MEIPFENIKDKLYSGRLKKYYNAGKLYKNFSEPKLEKIATTLDTNAEQYFRETLQQPDIRAYHDVMGQLTLIDSDIFGLTPGDYKESDLQCAFNVGQFFYNIKLLKLFNYGDNIRKVEEPNGLFMLNCGLEAITGQEVLPSDDNTQFNNTLKILSAYPSKAKNMRETLRCVEEEVEVASQQSQVISNKKRMKATSIIGWHMGQAMYKIMNETYQMPEWSEEFLVQQGKTANLFDDTKDFFKDKKNNQGYSLQYFPVLFANFWKEYYKTNRALPTFESFKRFNTFMFLGGVFQLEELFHLKSRS